MSIVGGRDSDNYSGDSNVGGTKRSCNYLHPQGQQQGGFMTAISRIFNRGFFVILGLTTLFSLVGIILLPGLGTYMDEVQAQTQPAEGEVPVVNHNTWTSGAPLPTPVYYPAAGVVKNEIYIVGGGVTYTEPTADVQIYNPATNMWSTGVPLPTPNLAAAAAVVKN